MRSESAFTLIELMIVIAIIAIIAAIAIPNILSARQTANERAAMATLRSIGTAQVQFQAAAKFMATVSKTMDQIMDLL